MKFHSTNYFNSFIQVAEDCPELGAAHPPKGKKSKSIAEMQFELISENPYVYTSDEILFRIFAKRQDLLDSELNEARNMFFSKGQPCLRTSSLAKRYGWGFHFNGDGKVAIFPNGSKEYLDLVMNSSIEKHKAMRSSKAPK